MLGRAGANGKSCNFTIGDNVQQRPEAKITSTWRKSSSSGTRRKERRYREQLPGRGTVCVSTERRHSPLKNGKAVRMAGSQSTPRKVTGDVARRARSGRALWPTVTTCLDSKSNGSP